MREYSLLAISFLFLSLLQYVQGYDNSSMSLAGYGLSFGVTAVVAILITLCCLYCDCCPLSRGRRRSPIGQVVYIGNAPVIGPSEVPVPPAYINIQDNPPPYPFPNQMQGQGGRIPQWQGNEGQPPQYAPPLVPTN